jgi:hypothetical protein
VNVAFTDTVLWEPDGIAHTALSLNDPPVMAEHNPTCVTAVDAGKLNVNVLVV